MSPLTHDLMVVFVFLSAFYVVLRTLFSLKRRSQQHPLSELGKEREAVAADERAINSVLTPVQAVVCPRHATLNRKNMTQNSPQSEKKKLGVEDETCTSKDLAQYVE